MPLPSVPSGALDVDEHETTLPPSARPARPHKKDRTMTTQEPTRFSRFAKANAVDAVDAPVAEHERVDAEAVAPAPSTPSSSFTITPQHAAFFAWVEDPAPKHRAAILEAVAGSGKTSTLIQATRRIPSTEKGIYVAFGKRVVDDIKGRLPAHIPASTMHSIGYRAVMAHFGRRIDGRADTRKTYKLFDEFTRRDPRLVEYGATVAKLVSKAKAFGIVPTDVPGTYGLIDDTPESWATLIEHFKIEPPNYDPTKLPTAIEIARNVLRLGLVFDEKHRSIDFDDQLYLVVAYRLALTRYKWVLVDEAQDISPVQRAMLHAMIAMKTGRLVAVGDPAQAIYGFRGSDADSLAAIAREFNATPFPLSISYRCPTSVVALAQPYVPHLTAAADAPVGEIQTNVPLARLDADGWRPTDLVVCRNNAPLVTLAYRLLKQRVACKVLGRDIGAGVKSLLKKLRAKDLPELLALAEEYKEQQTAKLLAAGKDAQVEGLEDRVETLKAFAVEARDLTSMERAIDDLFAEDVTSMVTLSSVHKAKGAEAPRVIILDPKRMPAKGARQDWEIQQERNIVYVAYTRARETLVFTSLDGTPAFPPNPF
jgi:DNA helicase II / ATP-dependent DNA helicase PcrA